MRKLSLSSLLERLEAHPQFEYVSDFEAMSKPFLCRHKDCGYEWKVSWGNINRGRGCPRCSGKERKTTASFKEEVEKLFLEIEVLGEYKNKDTKIKVQHKTCGAIWEITPHNLLKGRGCPECSASNGEVLVRSVLEKYNIEHSREHSFPDLVDKRTLRYDFAVYREGILVGLIEYDGEQHFKPVNFFGGEEGFKKTQHRDKIKNEYGRENCISLLRLKCYDSLVINEALIYSFLAQLDLVE